MDSCLFCQIAAGKLNTKVIYEDNFMVAFRDIYPAAQQHILLVPKKHIESMAHLQEEDAELMGKMMVCIPSIIKSLGFNKGFRTIINTGYIGGQEIYHLHIHILSGPDHLGPILAKQKD